MSNPAVEKYGWIAVPRKVELLLQQSEASGPAKPISVSSIQVPDSALVKAVHEYTKKELAIETFNHSMRVYYYGIPPTATKLRSKYAK
jgi:cyanamide hydratase